MYLAEQRRCERSFPYGERVVVTVVTLIIVASMNVTCTMTNEVIMNVIMKS